MDSYTTWGWNRVARWRAFEAKTVAMVLLARDLLFGEGGMRASELGTKKGCERGNDHLILNHEVRILGKMGGASKRGEGPMLNGFRPWAFFGEGYEGGIGSPVQAQLSGWRDFGYGRTGLFAVRDMKAGVGVLYKPS